MTPHRNNGIPLSDTNIEIGEVCADSFDRNFIFGSKFIEFF
ncbi:MAG: hypothetical protein U1F16_05235 [Turneriella sp.]